MRIGACDVCAAKDEIIADLRKQLADTTKSLLAVTDARAYALRYQAERPQREPPATPPKPPSSPDRLRAKTYTPPRSMEEIEKEFDAEHDLERRLGQA